MLKPLSALAIVAPVEAPTKTRPSPAAFMVCAHACLLGAAEATTKLVENPFKVMCMFNYFRGNVHICVYSNHILSCIFAAEATTKLAEYNVHTSKQTYMHIHALANWCTKTYLTVYQEGALEAWQCPLTLYMSHTLTHDAFVYQEGALEAWQKSFVRNATANAEAVSPVGGLMLANTLAPEHRTIYL